MKLRNFLRMAVTLPLLFSSIGLMSCTRETARREEVPAVFPDEDGGAAGESAADTEKRDTPSVLEEGPETDTQAAAMLHAILTAPDIDITAVTGTVYYVAPDGNDLYYGIRADHPRQTLKGVESLNLKPGDAVLFRRGGVWRGNFHAREGVIYGAYGEGDKPRIYGSLRNYADPALWEPTDAENVWRCTEEMPNVGIVVYNPSYEIGVVDDTVGRMCVKGEGGFGGYRQMNSDLQYYTDLDTKTLYVYSEKGNPGERFEAIEIGNRANIIYGASNTVFDNLTLMFGGAHCIGCGTCKNVTVRSCVFAWTGGSILFNTTRYGNAVEIFGGCDGFYVYNNYAYQLYDTGITFQNNSDADTPQTNVEIYDNLIEYCHWSIEFYNHQQSKTESYDKRVSDVDIHDNLIRYNGCGWGSVVRARGSESIKSCGIIGEVKNFVIHDNILDMSLGYHVSMQDYPGDRQVIFRDNTYIQKQGNPWMIVYGRAYDFYWMRARNIDEKLLGETGASIYQRTEPSE